MKNLFIGLVIGSIITWVWFHTGGKISITETKTVTNQIQVTVSVTETQVVEQIKWIDVCRTNWEVRIMTRTNIVEKIAPFAPVIPVAQPVQKARVESQIIQSVTSQTNTPSVTPSTQFKGPRSTGKITSSGGGKIKMGVKRNMDGSIKQ
jgi:hypothetical protein